MFKDMAISKQSQESKKKKEFELSETYSACVLSLKVVSAQTASWEFSVMRAGSHVISFIEWKRCLSLSANSSSSTLAAGLKCVAKTSFTEAFLPNQLNACVFFIFVKKSVFMGLNIVTAQS